jgi:hypothetical protein
MIKNINFKKFIVLLIFVLLIGLFAGCSLIVIPGPTLTGTVNINIVNDNWKYRIYLDGYSNLLGTTDYYGQKTFYNIPTGNHTFYAEDISGFYYGQTTEYIHTGINNVNIWVY